MTLTLALSALAMAFGGACVVAWGVVLRRDAPVRPLGGTLQARDGAAGSQESPEAHAASLAGSDAADWTAWRPSYDGEDHDPGEPYQRGETE